MSSLLRSTKFVRYFTGAARTLILNTAKTAEINFLNDTKVLCAYNGVLTRNYASSKKAESLEPLIQKLDLEVRKFGRVTKRDIDEIFDEIQSRNDITSSQSLMVIRCCGELVPEELPEQRTRLVQSIWSVLTERGIPMDISHYNALLRVYIENEHPFSPAKFLEELEKKGLQPNRVTYQRLMWRYCQEGDVDGATKILEKMRELNMPVSEPVLNALVMGHAFQGDTEGAKAVLETMVGAGLEPSSRTYALLACGYAKQGDMDGIQTVIKMAGDREIYMTDKDILDIVEYLAIGGHGDKVEQLFPHLKKGPGYNQEVCNLILRLLNKNLETTAKKIMTTMPKLPNSDDTPFKGAFFVKHLLRLNKPVESVIKTCRELQEESLVPNALFIATEGALQQGHSELAQSLFQELKKDGLEIRQHYYWPLLAKKGKEKDEEGLLQIIRNMTSEGIPPSGEALRDYVIPYLKTKETPQNIILKLQIANVPVVHSARNLMVDLLDSGKIKDASDIALKYCPRGQFSFVARPLLNALLKTKNVSAFVNILHVISSSSQSIQYEDEANTSDVQSKDHEIGRIILAAVKSLINPEICQELLTALHTKGLKISVKSAELIEQYFGQNMTTTLSETLSQLTSPDLEMVPIETMRRDYNQKTIVQLESLLDQMKNNGNKNINGIQKQLLSAYIKENNVEKLNSLVQELETSDFEFNVATLAQLYEFYCHNDDITKATECHTKIKALKPDFILNRYKLIQMAYALVRGNRYEDAIQFLKDNTPQDDEIEGSGFLLNSKTWQMLNQLAEQKDPEKVNEMVKVLVDNNYIEPSNVILGPSIKVHLLKDDIDGALKQFEDCCKQYRATPWKGELMKALIMKEDASRLQWLADLSTQIHGEMNILHDLVLAFVECGRLRQARRILETPGLQARQRRLQEACVRYVEEGKSEYLEGLLEATRELSHIDRSNIFYHLLVTYCKADETDKALGLWTILQEEGEVPSDKFLIYLGNHLKSKNEEVPFIIPESGIEIVKSVKKTATPKEPVVTRSLGMSKTIENLVDEGKLPQALDHAVKSIENGNTPQTNVMKYLLKRLADNGEVEKIQTLAKHLNEEKKRLFTYDNKLTLAMFKRGVGSHHVDNLFQAVQEAKTDKDLEIALVKYPRSEALALAINDQELSTKCHQIAEIAASRGVIMPANLLWMEYILSGKEKEADSLWEKCLKNTNLLVFRRILQESHTRNQPQHIEKLIDALKSNPNISMSSLGNAYSRLINYYIVNKKIDKAKTMFESALNCGLTSENFNKNSLNRLKSALKEIGQTFDYSF